MGKKELKQSLFILTPSFECKAERRILHGEKSQNKELSLSFIFPASHKIYTASMPVSMETSAASSITCASPTCLPVECSRRTRTFVSHTSPSLPVKTSWRERSLGNFFSTYWRHVFFLVHHVVEIPCVVHGAWQSLDLRIVVTMFEIKEAIICWLMQIFFDPIFSLKWNMYPYMIYNWWRK